MSGADLQAILPEIVLLVAGSVILLAEAFAPALRRVFLPLALVATAAAGWLAWSLPHGTAFGGQLESSPTTFAFTLIVLVSLTVCLLASESYLRREELLGGEYHAFLMWCGVGLLLMLRSAELLTFFVSLELFSLCLYTLAAFHRRIKIASEAAIKYFLMGAFVSSFVLLGIALVFGETGSLELASIRAAFAAEGAPSALGVLGLLLLVSGMGFKMSLVPFHAWSPDAYQGAPSPFGAFLSVAPKAASALVLVRLLEVASGGLLAGKWNDVVTLLAVASIVVGNLLALAQRDIKRMLAYSGVAHMGYLLVALVSLDSGSIGPVIVYLIAYALMNGGAFAIVSLLYGRPGEQHMISDLAGLGYRYPLLGLCLTVSMLSLAGIPPTAGFLGKYLVFLHAVGTGHTPLAVAAIAFSLVGVVYYLRVIYTLYMKPEQGAPQGLLIDGWGRLAAALTALGTLLIGIWPSRLVGWLLDAVNGVL